MDREKRRKLISSMLLYCLAGDLAIRINYGGILISRVENYLINEVVLKDKNHSYLAAIMTSVDNVIDGAIATRKDIDSPLDTQVLKNLVVTRTFPIDRSWAEEESRKGIVSIGDLSKIRMARLNYYAAVDAFAQSGKAATAYADSVKRMDAAMQTVVDVCDEYDLSDFGGNEWRANITVSKGEA